MSQSNSIIVNCRGEGTLHIMDLNDSITTRIKYTHSRAHSMICIVEFSYCSQRSMLCVSSLWAGITIV